MPKEIAMELIPQIRALLDQLEESYSEPEATETQETEPQSDQEVAAGLAPSPKKITGGY
jgi:hypothetical protein